MAYVILTLTSCVRVLRHFSHVQLFATLWTVACQAPLSMGFSRQEYWSGLPCTSPGHLPDPGSKPVSLMSPALAGEFFTIRATSEAYWLHAATAKSLQSCPTLWPRDDSPPGSPVPGILQARTHVCYDAATACKHFIFTVSLNLLKHL